MSILAGTRIGAYDIVSLLGEGGPACAARGVPPQLRRVLRSHEKTAP